MIDEEFQSKVEEFIKRHDLSPTTFGLWALNDSRFVFDLRNGRTCFGKTMRKVNLFMAAHEEKVEMRRRRQEATRNEAPAPAVPGGTPTVRDKFASHAGMDQSAGPSRKLAASKR